MAYATTRNTVITTEISENRAQNNDDNNLYNECAEIYNLEERPTENYMVYISCM